MMSALKRLLPLLLSCLLAAIFVGGTLFLRFHHHSQSTVNTTPISHTKLAAADGQHGHHCYVAISGLVYDIENSPDWQNGEHTTSNGQARCGRDLTSVIDKAPHGRSVLEELSQIGKLSK